MRNSFLPCSIMCLAFIILAQSVVAQLSDEQRRGCEERARSIGKTLDAGDIRRKVIEEGKFGDCVHHRWMDILKELGLKRALITIEYSLDEKGNIETKITCRTFLISYSSWAEVSDKHFDQKIFNSGVVPLIDQFIAEIVRDHVKALSDRGVYTIDITDDEGLPLLWITGESLM